MTWRRFLPGALRTDDRRWIVVDTETTGLDVARDVLLAIGGVAVTPAGVHPEDSFEVLVRNEAGCPKDTILVHGIGLGAQERGVPAAEALAAFAAWAGEAPLAGYHVAFDRDVLTRAAARSGVALATRAWLDVAPLAAALDPAPWPRGTPGLDDWLARYAIDCPARHSAAGDALATAELLVRLRERAKREGARGFDGLAKLAKRHRWLAAQGTGGAP